MRCLSEELSISKTYKLFLQDYFGEEYLRVNDGVKPEGIQLKLNTSTIDMSSVHTWTPLLKTTCSRVYMCSTYEELTASLENETEFEPRTVRLKPHVL
jgi:hypothetical protein